jgi:hypothetical protein
MTSKKSLLFLYEGNVLIYFGNSFLLAYIIHCFFGAEVLEVALAFESLE